MTDWIEFEGQIEAVQWGRSTYTIMRLPDGVVAALRDTKRVEVEIADHLANLALTRAPVVEGVFLWAGASLLKELGVKPGERFDVRLRPIGDDVVVLDGDVEVSLMANGVWDAWSNLTPGKQRGLLYQVASAKTEATRVKRIARLVDGLR